METWIYLLLLVVIIGLLGICFLVGYLKNPKNSRSPGILNIEEDKKQGNAPRWLTGLIGLIVTALGACFLWFGIKDGIIEKDIWGSWGPGSRANIRHSTDVMAMIAGCIFVFFGIGCFWGAYYLLRDAIFNKRVE